MSRHGENIRKRKDGRWEARYICGHQNNGKAKYKSIYGKSYAEVKEKREEILRHKNERHSKSAKNQITLSQLLYDWLIFKRTNVKESTYSRYTSIVNNHILPELGEIMFSELENEDIDYFIEDKLSHGRTDGKKGLSAKTVTDILSIIKQALAYGKERNYNYPDSLVIHNPRCMSPEIQILTLEEQKILEKTVFFNESSVHTGIIISLYMGLRIGEVCALKWDDFEFKSGSIYVHRTIQRLPDLSPNAQKKTHIVIDEPKTECSRRRIPIPSFLLNYFIRHQKEREYYVLTGSERYLEPRSYYRYYKKIMQACGLPQYNYHALRHTFATRCVENNFDIKSLSEILGHSDVSITLQRYVHPSMKLKQQHMDKLGSITIYGQNSGQIA